MEEKNAIPLLETERLTVERPREFGEKDIGLRDVTFRVETGEFFALVGESGSGKSLLARLIAGAPGPGEKVLSGSIHFEGRDILRMSRKERRLLRCRSVGLVTRDPHNQFNPDRTVGHWLRETVRLSRSRGVQVREDEWSDFFYCVGIVEPERILEKPLRDLTAMMLQRLMVMKALLARAKLLICDDATADLDRIAASQFIDIVKQARSEHGLSILMTLGSLRGVEEFADRTAVLYEGGVLECGPSRELVEKPQYLYTRELLTCAPRISRLPHELTTISREAVREAEEAVHRQASGIVTG